MGHLLFISFFFFFLIFFEIENTLRSLAVTRKKYEYILS